MSVLEMIFGDLAAEVRKLKRAPKHCRRCGGFHAGRCQLVQTAHGTLCRRELVELVEKRERDRRRAAW